MIGPSSQLFLAYITVVLLHRSVILDHVRVVHGLLLLGTATWPSCNHLLLSTLKWSNQCPTLRLIWMMNGSDVVLLGAGLSTSFSAGTIYCSKVTANLLVKDMRINPSCIQPLPLDIPLLVDGIHVTLIDANHCPGAVLFLFKSPAPPGSEFPEQVLVQNVPSLLLVKNGLLKAVQASNLRLSCCISRDADFDKAAVRSEGCHS